jgi:uncharacterized radical SAM superfamily Fe-S cluster-containing enzyme
MTETSTEIDCRPPGQNGAGGPSAVNPSRYFSHITQNRSAVAAHPPVCLYLETTNRCNLLCTICPRTYEELEPPADMSWELFTRIVDQFPAIERAVLHGVGEPMLVKHLARMVQYLVRLNNPWVEMTGRLSPVRFCGKFRWIFEQGNGLA